MIDPRAFIAYLPVSLVKARTDETGRRLVELAASTELTDLQGDCILQKALLDAAAEFIRNGHLDIDHRSELYEDLGITNPDAWIVGRPLEVWDGGGGQTMVLCHLRKSAEHDPNLHTWDALWDSLQTDPPVAWRASVYGFIDPSTTLDCREEACAWKGPGPAPTRFLVSKFDWRSLAFTRHPVNDGISSYARIVSAKAWVTAVKAQRTPLEAAYQAPITTEGGLVGTVVAHDPEADAKHRAQAEAAHEKLEEHNHETEEAKAAGLLGEHYAPPKPSMPVIDGEISHGECPTCGGLLDAPSTALWRSHLHKCLGWDSTSADVGAHAAMYRMLLSQGWGRRRSQQKRVPEAPPLTESMEGPVVYGPGNQSLAPGWHRPAHLANTRP